MHTGDKLEGAVCKCMDCARARQQRRENEDPQLIASKYEKHRLTTALAILIEERLALPRGQHESVVSMTPPRAVVEVVLEDRPFTITIEPTAGVLW